MRLFRFLPLVAVGCFLIPQTEPAILPVDSEADADADVDADTDTDADSDVDEEKVVFVTSAIYDGDLATAAGVDDGLAGGDLLCSLAGQGAGLGGDFVAWLSTDETDAIDRLPDDGGPWVDTFYGSVVFLNKAAVQASTPADTIDRTELGGRSSASFWTGTSFGGRSSGEDCRAWTAVRRDIDTGFSDQLLGTTGSGGGGDWSDSSSGNCTYERHLLCFQVD